MSEFIYTSLPDRSAVEDLKKKVKRKDYGLAILFLTKSLLRYVKELSKLFEKTVCVQVEGFAVKDEVWTRGGILWLIDEEVEVERYFGDADSLIDRLKRSKSSSSSLLFVPVIYLKGKLSILTSLIKERKIYEKYKKGDSYALIEASKLLRERFVYPINDVLRVFRDRNEKVLSINLMPLEIGFNEPKIFIDGREVGRSLVRVKIKADLEYYDTFPERGKSLEENVEILRNEINISGAAEADFYDVAIGHVNGKTVSSYAVYHVNNLVNSLEKSRYLTSSPRNITFLSRETLGCFVYGILDLRSNIYPSLVNLNNFYKNVYISENEIRYPLIPRIIEFLEKSDCYFYAIDPNYLLIFEGRVFEFSDYLKDSFAVFVYSSATLSAKNLFTEVEKNIFINFTRNVAGIRL
ncbi:MAG: hypothetical protein RMI31_04725 [Archaeoglobaceae archaeon]|nr:hypothetical protein [Archaeoglobaceae archaeon]